MRSDAIFAVWHQGKAEYVERIEREVRNRLLGTNSLINGIRERLDKAAGRSSPGRRSSGYRRRSTTATGALAAGVRGPARVDPSATWASASADGAAGQRLRDGETLH